MDLNLPQAFCERMKENLGQEYDAFLASYQNPRYQALRVNTLKLSKETFLNLSPWQLAPVPWAENGFYYGADDRPGKSPLHEAGLYYIQEPSAMAVAALSGTRPGEAVLDLCAAPGGKSTQLAGLLQGQGLLISNEIHPQRAKILSRNMERLGVKNAVVTNEAPEDLAPHFPAFFDRIIVDAPCSGEGMFRKEEAAIPNWSPQQVRADADRQRIILEIADIMLKPGGTLVYSTCTFSPEENEENIVWFLESHPSYLQVDLPARLGENFERWGFVAGSDGKSLRLLPHHLKGEGHFLAILQKSADATVANQEASGLDPKTKQEPSRKEKKKRKKQNAPGAYPDAKRLWNEFADMALATKPQGTFVQFGNELYLLPQELDLTKIKVLRPGLHLGTLKKNRFEPSHALVLALKKGDFCHTLDLTGASDEAHAYLRGESLPCPEKGWTAVTVDGYPLGWGKSSGGVLKNHYPKGLRIF